MITRARTDNTAGNHENILSAFLRFDGVKLGAHSGSTLYTVQQTSCPTSRSVERVENNCLNELTMRTTERLRRGTLLLSAVLCRMYTLPRARVCVCVCRWPYWPRHQHVRGSAGQTYWWGRIIMPVRAFVGLVNYDNKHAAHHAKLSRARIERGIS